MQQRVSASSQREPYSVSALSRYVREMFDVDYRLRDVWIEGEVSGVSRPASGHVYFTLKDATAQVRAVLWRDAARLHSKWLVQGAQVLAHGHVSVYEAGGVYQLYADSLQPAGAGDLHRQFEWLKTRLEAEGLFDPARKRTLPARPRCIGLVTSPSTAAIQDIFNVLRRRWPLAEVILSPTPVQGEDAPPKIVAALEALYRYADTEEGRRLDVILVARGGGSIEDLWCFNDERVARALAASPRPVVTGIGHEIDFTIADFVADRRAPTPSAAAELITPDRADAAAEVQAMAGRLAAAMQAMAQKWRWQVQAQARAVAHLSPQARLADARQRLDEAIERARRQIVQQARLRRERLDRLQAHLQALNPLAVLERGYAIVRHAERGVLVSSITQLEPGDRITVRVADGEFEGVVD